VPADEWRPRAGTTQTRSLRLCETARGWLVHGPDLPASAGELVVRPFRCWSASCRRCGPIVGAQDLARLEPAITGRRWVYLVVTLDPSVLAALQAKAAARRAKARDRWIEAASARIGPPPRPLTFRDLDPLFGYYRSAAGRAEAVEHRDAGRAWFELARDAVPMPKGRDLSTDPYHVASAAWSARLRRHLLRLVGPFDYVLTWERHRSGLPHANILVDAEAFAAAGLLGGLRAGRVAKTGRPTVYPPALRRRLRAAAMAAGFGRVFHLELAEARGAALACYVAKLARELMSSRTKGPDGQTPTNRPRGFRRFSATHGLLAVRHWPKGRRLPCWVEGCTHEAPPGGWCSRSLPRHVVDVHGLDPLDARQILRDLIDQTPASKVALLEGDRPRASEVARVARLVATDPVGSAAWRAAADQIERGEAAPLFVAENGTAAPLLF
jgi:hypothetical protein